MPAVPHVGRAARTTLTGLTGGHTRRRRRDTGRAARADDGTLAAAPKRLTRTASVGRLSRARTAAERRQRPGTVPPPRAPAEPLPAYTDIYALAGLPERHPVCGAGSPRGFGGPFRHEAPTVMREIWLIPGSDFFAAVINEAELRRIHRGTVFDYKSRMEIASVFSVDVSVCQFYGVLHNVILVYSYFCM